MINPHIIKLRCNTLHYWCGVNNSSYCLLTQYELLLVIDTVLCPARIQNFLKGGGGEDIHKHPPLNIARVATSPSALRTFTSTPPPLPHRSRSRTLCRGFQDQDKFKGGGGGGDHPCHRHPGSATGVSSHGLKLNEAACLRKLGIWLCNFRTWR